jgi:hypothetical protein
MNGSQPFRGAVVLDIIDGTNLIRVAFPDAQVTDRGDISIVNGDASPTTSRWPATPTRPGTPAIIYVASDAAS